MRLCIVGNSHVAPMRKAWTDGLDKRFPHIEITWFASRRGAMSALVARDGQLVPGTKALSRSIEFTSGGKSEIVIEDYDAFLVCGMHGHDESIRRTFYSEAVYAQGLADKVTSQLNHRLVTLVRSLTDKPLWTAHNPLPAFDPAQLLAVVDYSSQVAEMQERFYSPMSVSLVAQPEVTVESGSATKAHFALDSERLKLGREIDGESHPAGEIFHMNREYGRIWLDAFLSQLLDSQ